MSNKGLLIVISGPSGAGKGTLCKELTKNYGYDVSISATTRNLREGEVDGVNYYFLSEEQFKERLLAGEFLEYAKVYGNYYGTPKSEIESKLNSDKDVILEIDIQGTLQVQEVYKNAVYIFILPPSIDELRNRILKRGSETDRSFNLRFSSVNEEIKHVSRYDYIVVNDDLEDAVKKIDSIIKIEKLRVSRLNIDEILLL